MIKLGHKKQEKEVTQMVTSVSIPLSTQKAQLYLVRKDAME